ncbi:Glutaredoxin-C1 [Asimina triloba]
MERVISGLASRNALVIFSSSSCCMCHAVKRLFCELGANATVYEVNEEPSGREMETALAKLLGSCSAPVPAVFIGGRLVGPTDRVMSLHLNGALVPLLKQAGALWV